MNKHNVSEKKQKKDAKKLEKQKEQKTTKPFMKKDDAYMMKPYQSHHPMNAKHPNMMKPYQANHPNMMKPPMMSQISKHMSVNK